MTTWCYSIKSKVYILKFQNKHVDNKLIIVNKVNTLAAVTKEMSIGEVVMKWPASAGVFMQHGLHCYGCAAARYETIEQGAQAHGVDPEILIKAINEEIEKKEE